MIVVDVNLLLFACFSTFSHHERARAWWEDVLNTHRPVGLCGPVAFGFVRLATSRKVFEQPLALQEALATLDDWLGMPAVTFLPDSVHHLAVTADLLREAGSAAGLTTDAQIAAHARLARGTVYSHDRDFGRFPTVPWIDPL